jgi:hypothetical protein
MTYAQPNLCHGSSKRIKNSLVGVRHETHTYRRVLLLEVLCWTSRPRRATDVGLFISGMVIISSVIAVLLGLGPVMIDAD